VLAQVNRIRIGSDYQVVVRRGVRVVGPHTVTCLRMGAGNTPVRFGFIVAKNVGNAVVRNRVRRRLKAASFELLPKVPPGTDIVFRALPSIAVVEWSDLAAELTRGITAAVAKGQRSR